MGLAGCIVEFNPNLNTDADDLLVVEGTITDGETVISLNWSVDLKSSDNTTGPGRQARPVSGARVWVESEAGGSFPSEERFERVEHINEWGQTQILSVSTGRYYIATGTLDDNTRYRVRIESAGEEYVSTWRPPQATPPVGEIDLHGEDGMVQVRLDVTGEQDGARSFMWSYEETWETQAEVNPSHYYGMWDGDYNDQAYSMWDALENDRLRGRLWQYRYPDHVSPFFYCWKYNKSKEVLIADTKRVSENSLRDHVLFEFEDYNDRLSVLYHLKLMQYAIGDDAFLYLTILKENTDNTGSIFSPIPSEMRGNLVCTTSPETHVIGFVEVSHLVVNEIFINSADSPYQRIPSGCEVIDWEQLVAMGVSSDPGIPASKEHFREYYLVLGVDTPPGAPPMSNMYAISTFAPLRCIDCRTGGGSKNRPDWWPNDHI